MKWLAKILGRNPAPSYPPIKATGSPNYSAGSSARTVERIFLHNTEGELRTSLSWLQMPVAQASAHYMVDRDGSVYQLVSEANVAWHSGVRAENWRSIGIEIVAYSAKGKRAAALGMTPDQEAAVVRLVKAIMAKYAVPVDGVLPHRAVKGTACPGLIWPTDKEFNEWKVEKLS